MSGAVAKCFPRRRLKDETPTRRRVHGAPSRAECDRDVCGIEGTAGCSDSRAAVVVEWGTKQRGLAGGSGKQLTTMPGVGVFSALFAPGLSGIGGMLARRRRAAGPRLSLAADRKLRTHLHDSVRVPPRHEPVDPESSSQRVVASPPVARISPILEPQLRHLGEQRPPRDPEPLSRLIPISPGRRQRIADQPLLHHRRRARHRLGQRAILRQ